MPSPSPATRQRVTPPKSRGSSSRKSVSDSKESVAANKAREAFGRTVEKRPSLPLDAAGGGDPAREGLTRLRGAYLIQLTRIRPDPDQPRREFAAKDLDDLTNSVRERGVRQPIRVRYLAAEQMYQVIAGERRFRAATAAGLLTIPCLIEDAKEKLGPVDILVEQVVENWQRADLRPVELSNALVKMRDTHGMSQEEIARRTGKSPAEISKLLAIQNVDAEILAQATGNGRKQFNRRKLVAIAGLPVDEQRELARQVRSGMPTIEVETEAKRRKLPGMKHSPVKTGWQRRYAVGSAVVQVTFRKQDASDAEILEVLHAVERMVRERKGDE